MGFAGFSLTQWLQLPESLQIGCRSANPTIAVVSKETVILAEEFKMQEEKEDQEIAGNSPPASRLPAEIAEQ